MDTLPVAVWIQTGDCMSNLSQWDADRASVTTRDVMLSLPAILRSLAIAIDQHNEEPCPDE